MRLTYVSADDWAGVYKDGVLIIEGHSIAPIHWLMLLREANVSVVDKGESQESYNVIQSFGSCPATLNGWDDIAKEDGKWRVTNV